MTVSCLKVISDMILSRKTPSTLRAAVAIITFMDSLVFLQGVFEFERTPTQSTAERSLLLAY